MSTSTPWGMSQDSDKVAVGIMQYSTASHGGFHLSKKRNALIPEYMRDKTGWYEEDDQWCLAAVVFPNEFMDYYGNRSKPLPTKTIVDIAEDTFMNVYPNEYEKFYNVKIVAGQSHERDQQTFKEKNKNNYVVISVLDTVGDMLEVFATLGGQDRTHGGRYFKISLEAYRNRTNDFIIDVDNHMEIVK